MLKNSLIILLLIILNFSFVDAKEFWQVDKEYGEYLETDPNPNSDEAKARYKFYKDAKNKYDAEEKAARIKEENEYNALHKKCGGDEDCMYDQNNNGIYDSAEEGMSKSEVADWVRENKLIEEANKSNSINVPNVDYNKNDLSKEQKTGEYVIDATEKANIYNKADSEYKKSNNAAYIARKQYESADEDLKTADVAYTEAIQKSRDANSSYENSVKDYNAIIDANKAGTATDADVKKAQDAMFDAQYEKDISENDMDAVSDTYFDAKTKAEDREMEYGLANLKAEEDKYKADSAQKLAEDADLTADEAVSNLNGERNTGLLNGNNTNNSEVNSNVDKKNVKEFEGSYADALSNSQKANEKLTEAKDYVNEKEKNNIAAQNRFDDAYDKELDADKRAFDARENLKKSLSNQSDALDEQEEAQAVYDKVLDENGGDVNNPKVLAAKEDLDFADEELENANFETNSAYDASESANEEFTDAQEELENAEFEANSAKDAFIAADNELIKAEQEAKEKEGIAFKAGEEAKLIKSETDTSEGNGTFKEEKKSAEDKVKEAEIAMAKACSGKDKDETKCKEKEEELKKAKENYKNAKNAYDNSDEAKGNITSRGYEISVNDISPGMGVVGSNTDENVNYLLSIIIQNLMIALGSFALLIMTIGGGYIVLHHGQDELLSKGKSIFMSGIYALVVALSSYYLINIIRFILYQGS